MDSYEFLIKLVVALLLGLLIGIDRQLKHKPLGIKTSMVISVASCLITLVSIQSVQKFSIPGKFVMDPMRLTAQIVSGVGFIGAGVILRRNNDVISGLTTAALIWAASGLGIAAGAGFYKEAVCAVMLIILAINFLPQLFKLLGPSKLSERDLSIQIIVKDNDEMTSLIDEIELNSMTVKRIKVKDMTDDRQQIQLVVSTSYKLRTTTVYYILKKMKYVVGVEIENISS